MDLLFEEQDIPEGAEEFFAMYAVEYEPGKHAVHLDNARFINHSKDPNTRPTGGFEPSVAIRDIQEGEEITIDYEAIDVNAIDF